MQFTSVHWWSTRIWPYQDDGRSWKTLYWNYSEGNGKPSFKDTQDAQMKWSQIFTSLLPNLHLLLFHLPSWYSMIAPSRLQLAPLLESMWQIQRILVWRVRVLMEEPADQSGIVTSVTAHWGMMGNTARKVSCRCCFELLKLTDMVLSWNAFQDFWVFSLTVCSLTQCCYTAVKLIRINWTEKKHISFSSNFGLSRFNRCIF